MSLTPRQIEIVQCLKRGLSNKEIARELTISHGTVKAHLVALSLRLRAKNRTEAAILGDSLLPKNLGG